ncbi:hypothetical protein [Solirubrobacter soli]|uniref:hypothetical protein n=1 Tax=Solirubrobacter soli TaxID=363832 RepID=UPI0004841994|nr:hypothetical protein [Solirubrobacter soli]
MKDRSHRSGWLIVILAATCLTAITGCGESGQQADPRSGDGPTIEDTGGWSPDDEAAGVEVPDAFDG